MPFDIFSFKQLEIHGYDHERVYDGQQRRERANKQRKFASHDQTAIGEVSVSSAARLVQSL
jgi:hypothetical protein